MKSSMTASCELIKYTPYGYTPWAPLDVGFNGEYCNRLGLYALGNGYRYYSPPLGRFMAPDTLSPFSEGGLNAYVYCQGDPVNHLDPSGHFIKRMYNYVSGKYSARTLKRKLEAIVKTPTHALPLTKENTFSEREFKHLENHLIDTITFSKKMITNKQLSIERENIKWQSPLKHKDRQAGISKKTLAKDELKIRAESAETYLAKLRQLQPVNVDDKKRFSPPQLIRDPQGD